jgi:adenine/guanine phosphoribosyltransferase-like PRPP-binding protein
MNGEDFSGVGERIKEGGNVRVILVDDIIVLGRSADAGRRLV